MAPVFACTLLISHPPHGQVDAARAASHLGLSAPDLAVKANYPIPEIWAAEEDEARARTLASAIGEAGIKLALASGQALADIPPHDPVQSVSVTELGVVLLAEGRRVELAWDARLLGVYYTPRAGGGAKEQPSRGVRERGAACDAPFFDLFVPGGDALGRFAALANLTEFAGLGESGTLSPAGRVARFAQLCEERFPAGQVDRRLLNMQIRHWPPPATLVAPHLVRKGFSFSSAGLAELLGKLGPALAEPSHCEFASRLVYLTWRFGEEAGS